MLRQPCDNGVITGAPVRPGCRESDRPWILVATILGSSLAFIDSTVVNVALPVLQADFRTTVTDMQWIIESYALFLSSLLLIGGAAGDLFGRRLIYLAGVVLFTAASVLCAVANDIHFLVIARGIQGIGGALLVPGSLAIISASFEEKDRGRAIGTWSGFTSITAAVGPVLGGWIVQHASWRWIFLINLPVAVVVLVLVARHVPESRRESGEKQLDWPGAAFAALGLGGIVYGLVESSNRGWADRVVIGAIGAGLAALAFFLVQETRAKDPMLPPGLFRSRNFSGANLLTLFQYAAMSGALFFLPFNLIQVQGYTPTQAGASLLPFILLMFLLSRWAGGLVQRFGPKLPLLVGPVITAAGFGLLSIPGEGGAYWTTFFPGIVVLGFGMTLVVAPLTTTVMNSVPRDRSGIASGVNNAVSRVAALLAVAVFGIVLVQTFSTRLDRSLSDLHLNPEIRRAVEQQRTKLAGIEVPPETPAAQTVQIKKSIGRSYISGFRSVMLLASLLSLLSACCAWILIR